MSKIPISKESNLYQIVDQLPNESAIELDAGVWSVNLLLKKSISITGVGGTILDGGGRGPVISVENSDIKVALNNLVIRNGKSDAGGGIYLSKESRVALNNIIVCDNFANREGGGVFATMGQLKIVNSKIERNKSRLGGGVKIGGRVSAQIENCLFVENAAETGSGVCVSDGSIASFQKCEFNENLMELPWGIGRDIYIQGTMTRQPKVSLDNCTFNKGFNVICSGRYPGELIVKNTICPEAIKYVGGFIDGTQNKYYPSSALEPISSIYVDQFNDLLRELFDENGHPLSECVFDENFKPLARLGILQVLSDGKAVLLKGIDEIFSTIFQTKVSIQFHKTEFKAVDSIPKKETNIFIHQNNGKTVEHHVSHLNKHWYSISKSGFDMGSFLSYLTNEKNRKPNYLDGDFTLSLPVTQAIFKRLPFTDNIPNLNIDDAERINKLTIGLQSMVIVAINVIGKAPLPIGLTLLKSDGLSVIKLKVSENKVDFMHSSTEKMFLEIQHFLGSE